MSRECNFRIPSKMCFPRFYFFNIASKLCNEFPGFPDCVPLWICSLAVLACETGLVAAGNKI